MFREGFAHRGSYITAECRSAKHRFASAFERAVAEGQRLAWVENGLRHRGIGRTFEEEFPMI